jgi:hypothetical protein
MTYRDLPEVGMPFVTPEDPRFDELKSQISLDRFGRKPEDLPSEAVVVLNQSGQPVLAMSFLWKWTDDAGTVTQHRMHGLSSLSQLQFEPADPRRIRFHPFLAGSKRLVTPAGVFGDNSDVLPPDATPSGFVGGFAGGFGRGNTRQPERHLAEIQLDSVIFADGLCAGPDEMGLLTALDPVATEQQRLASTAAALLRRGATFGEVFDLLRTTARHPGPTSAPQTADPLHLLFSFGRQAVDRLIHAQDERRDELANWFTEQSLQPKVKLRRYE